MKTSWWGSSDSRSSTWDVEGPGYTTRPHFFESLYWGTFFYLEWVLYIIRLLPYGWGTTVQSSGSEKIGLDFGENVSSFEGWGSGLLYHISLTNRMIETHGNGVVNRRNKCHSFFANLVDILIRLFVKFNSSVLRQVKLNSSKMFRHEEKLILSSSENFFEVIRKHYYRF